MLLHPVFVVPYYIINKMLTTGVTFSGSFTITPGQLVEAQKSVPIDRHGYIPRGVRELDDSFTHVVPVLTRLGGGAISMSFDMPFGFRRPVDSGRLEPASQQTDGIILSPDSADTSAWQAILDTPKPLTKEDIGLFNNGMRFYAGFAARKLKAGNSQPAS
jgi:hypothetical protein